MIQPQVAWNGGKGSAEGHTPSAGGVGVSPANLSGGRAGSEIAPPGQRAAAAPRLPSAPAERKHPESDLWRLWEGQRFPKASLITADGRALRVVFRGQPGRGPGPDFRGAIISAPEGLLQGDVELHVRTSDFRRHGHHLDPAYADIALHVVFFHDEDGETELPGGRMAPVVTLGGPRLAAWLERAPRWGEPCRDSLGRLGADEVGRTLERLGAMRFRQKAAVFRKRLAGGEEIEQALWSGLLEALAFGGEREAFRQLALDAPWDRVRSEAASGAGEMLQGAFMPVAVRRGIRPGNSASRRLAGAAILAERFAEPGLAASLIGPLAEPETAAADIVSVLVVPHLVGRARAIEIAANAVLPLAAALCGDEGAWRVEGVFAQLPLPARYGSVRHLHEAASGLGLDARRQQGMLYLQNQYCTRGGCGRCPLS